MVKHLGLSWYSEYVRFYREEIALGYVYRLLVKPTVYAISVNVA